MIWLAALLLLAKPVGYVNDFVGVISPAVETELETRLESFTASTGNELAVVTVKSLEGDTVENTAVALFEQWGIGQKGKDNGVLLLIASNERELKIEVGYGLEPVLTDSRAGTIIRDVITPKFKENDYDAGITEGAEAIITVLTGDAVAFDQPVSSFNNDGGWMALIIVFIVVIAFVWIIKRQAKKGPWRFKKSSWGGWSSGKSSGGSFGGFSGGSSGGGGSSGKW